MAFSITLIVVGFAIALANTFGLTAHLFGSRLVVGFYPTGWTTDIDFGYLVIAFGTVSLLIDLFQRDRAGRAGEDEEAEVEEEAKGVDEGVEDTPTE